MNGVDLKQLNKEQKAAVIHGKGPLLIVAGAGTGKTTVVTGRIAHLIEKKLAKPDEILALTFTDKASGEMEDRVGDLLSLGYVDMWVSTYHSFCERILRDHGLDIGLPTNFKLVDQTAAWLLVRQNMDKFRLKYYKPLGNPTKFIHALISHFSRCKDQEVFPDDYLAYSAGDIDDKEKVREIADTYRIYQKLLLDNDLLDFGDLLNYAVKLLKKRPAILEKYRRQFKYVLVDEFQDTNWIQYEMVRLLAAPKNNLTVCADDDQAIYRWRGASFGNIVQFKKDFPKAAQVVLVKNYRSCQNILDISYKFIQANNPNRLECINKIDKRLLAAAECEGKIEHYHYATVEQEVQGVVNSIVKILKADTETTFNDIAILVRANESANAFARACERSGVPYQFMALKGLYSRPVILDIISYFKLLDNLHESSAAWRVLNMQFLRIPPQDIARLTQHSYRKAQALFETLEHPESVSGLSEQAARGIAMLMGMIQKHGSLIYEKNASEIMLGFLEDSGYLEHLVKEERRTDIGYIGQFYGKIKSFEEANVDPSLKRFVAELNMELESGEEGKLNFDLGAVPDVVRIMTIHAAKGLEFKHVFIVNLVDRKFPTSERAEQIELPQALIKDIIPGGDVHLEEERRLFYVAVTRAKQGLYFTSAREYGGAKPKKVSRFLTELGYDGGSEQPEVKNVRISNHKKSRPMLALPDHFSFTQLASFQKCPMQYKFAHILKIPIRGKAVFSYGKTMHNALYEFLSDGKKSSLNIERLKELYRKNWIDEWYDGKEERELYFQQGLRSLELFLDDFKSRKPRIHTVNGEPALEIGFNVKIGGHTINGKIDRIDEAEKGVEIIDYKTGTVKEKLRPEDKQQLLIYHIAAKEVFDLDVKQLTYYYLEEGKPTSFSSTAADIEGQKEKIAELVEKIKTSDFRAKPGWHCDWCDFRDICEFAKK